MHLLTDNLGHAALNMRLLVALQRRRLRERLVTRGTCIRPLARVYAFVTAHARAVAECARAYRTYIRFLAGVGATVTHEPRELVEDTSAVFALVTRLTRPRTHGASEWWHMDFRMIFQFDLLLELFSALRSSKHAFRYRFGFECYLRVRGISG